MTTETLTAPAATYGERKTAARAARQALGADKISGVHYRIVEAGDRFAWTPLEAEDAAPAPTAQAEPQSLPTPAPEPVQAEPAIRVAAAKAPRAPKVEKPARKIADNGPDLPKGKLGVVIGMMQRQEGATNEQMQAATGWQ